MKKKIYFLLTFLLSINISFGLTSEQKKYLLNLGIFENQINEVIVKKQVSRYSTTRILNYALCYDCMFPPKHIKDKYDFGWFSNFRKQPNFYLNDINPQNLYYYCIVSLASKDYIHGYPSSNSICGGEFCGDNNLLLGELYQIVLNIISLEIWSNYKIKNPENFYKNILSIKGTLKQNQVNILDSEIKLAKKISEYGNVPYTISNFKEFFLYQKYCNLFPKDCGFIKFDNINEFAISLINILYKEGLLSLKDISNFNYSKLVDGKTLINWLYKVKKINTCKIDRDYDKDGILNEEDNCPYTYNPNQKDTDKDGIGDVCDPDIDNDQVKNPIGVVDYKGNIVIEKILQWEKEGKKIDNCLFIPNSNQEDINRNGIGDACEKLKLSLGLEISCNPLKGEVPLTTNCEAFPEGDYKKIYWFYDGKLIGEGKKISYTFLKEGDKKIQAAVIGDSGEAKANAFFHVTNLKSKSLGGKLEADPLKSLVGEEVKFKIIPEGFDKEDVENVKWIYGDREVEENRSLDTNHIYTKEGSYFVKAIVKLKSGQVVIVSLTQMVSGEDICSNLEKAKEKLKCDMDKDGIPDMCDSDIDGDGINNLLGLIKYETPDCKYTNDNVNHDVLQQEHNLSLEYNFDDDLNNDIDNCPFKQNPGQIDVDENGVGDACEDKFTIIIDTDGDGIPDSEDMCPTIPENYNGIQDLDGCPEIKYIDGPAIFKIVNCDTCPCQFADYANPFSFGLNVYAGLINPFSKNVYIFSKPKKIGY